MQHQIQKRMNKIIIPLGIVSGLALATAMLYPLLNTDFSNIGEESTGFAEILLSSAGAIIAMIIISRKFPETSFPQLVKRGVFTALVSITVFFVMNIIFHQWVRPEFLAEYFDALTSRRAEMIEDVDKKTTYLAQSETDKNIYTNPFLYTGIQTVVTFMISLMPIAIAAYIIFRIKRRQKR